MGMTGALKQVWPKTEERIIEDPAFLADLLFAEDGDYLNLDKSWDGLHYLLSMAGEKHDSSLTEAVLGGTPLAKDPNFVVIFVKSPSRVARIADSISALSSEELYQYFQVEEMNERSLYPHIDWQEEDFQYLYRYFTSVVDYYQEAAERNKAMVFCIW